tara:strand:+ start:1068 stop:3020 length:1953 start_codon:yes stop_codon:yes gene_type:complete
MAITNYKDRMAAEELAKSTARWDAALKAGYKPSDYGYDKHGNKTSEYTGFELPKKKKRRREAKAEAPEEELTEEELLKKEVFQRARRDARVEDEKKQRDAMLNSDTPPGGSKPASEDAVNPYKTKRLEKEAKSASWETTPSPTHGRPSIWNADTGKWEDVSSRPPEGREVKTDSGNWYIPSGNTFRKNEARKAREAKDLKHEQNFDDWAEVQRAKREKEAAESKSPKPMGAAEITPGGKKPTPETTPDTTPDMGDDPVDDAAGRAIRAAATVGLGIAGRDLQRGRSQQALGKQTRAMREANRKRRIAEKQAKKLAKKAARLVKTSNVADANVNRIGRHVDKINDIESRQLHKLQQNQTRLNKIAQNLKRAQNKLAQPSLKDLPKAAKKATAAVLKLTQAWEAQAKKVEHLKGGAARIQGGAGRIVPKFNAAADAADQAKDLAKKTLDAADVPRNKADAAKRALDSARKNAANIVKGGRAAGVGAAMMKPLEALGKVRGAKTVGKVLSKVAAPLELGMNIYEGAQLIANEDHRKARQKEFDKYADTGVLRSTYESAMNPVAGIYTAANRLNEWSMSYGAAKKSASAYEKAKFKSDKFKAALEAAGLTDPPEGAGSLDYGERKKEGSTPEQDAIIRQWRAARKKVRDVVYAS